jgi:hypothetical protein
LSANDGFVGKAAKKYPIAKEEFPSFAVCECDTLLFLVLTYLMRQLKLV